MDHRPQPSHHHRRLSRRATLGLAGMLLCASAAAHHGALDSYGCHPNVAHGSYHCHDGMLAGKAYASKVKMLETYRTHQQDERVRARAANPPQAQAPTSHAP